MSKGKKNKIVNEYYKLKVSQGGTLKRFRKDSHVFSYRMTGVRELLPSDLPQRRQLCERFLPNIDYLLDKTVFLET